MNKQRIQYACNRLGVDPNASIDTLNLAYKSKVANADSRDSKELDELYSLYSFLKNNIKNQNHLSIQPLMSSDNIFNSFHNMNRIMDQYMTNFNFDSESDSNNKNYSYHKKFTKIAKMNDKNKSESKIYTEINKNGKIFYEEQINDGSEIKIKRIYPNGEVKEYIKHNNKLTK
jgi:hypothetical protein